MMGKPIFLTLNNITNSKTPAPWKECIHPRYELLVNAGSHFQTPASKSPKTVSSICKAELSLLFLLIILLRSTGTVQCFIFSTRSLEFRFGVQSSKPLNNEMYLITNLLRRRQVRNSLYPVAGTN
jgi:hypothetical protein